MLSSWRDLNLQEDSGLERLLISDRIAPKKISAATFTSDGKHIIMADKFGDVYVAVIPDPNPAGPGSAGQQLLDI